MLGLHEQIGGSPDHITIAAISEPVAGHDGATSEALLLHDIVPGGTGYLAELANPERMWDLLHRAWERVRDCPCQHEQRLACHRCLVPFAPAGRLNRVSRSAAERHLRAILTSGTPDAEPTDAMSWSLTAHEPVPPSPESHLEQSFRKVFTERVTALGATVKETPGPQGNRLSITFPGAHPAVDARAAGADGQQPTRLRAPFQPGQPAGRGHLHRRLAVPREPCTQPDRR